MLAYVFDVEQISASKVKGKLVLVPFSGMATSPRLRQLALALLASDAQRELDGGGRCLGAHIRDVVGGGEVALVPYADDHWWERGVAEGATLARCSAPQRANAQSASAGGGATLTSRSCATHGWCMPCRHPIQRIRLMGRPWSLRAGRSTTTRSEKKKTRTCG